MTVLLLLLLHTHTPAATAVTPTPNCPVSSSSSSFFSCPITLLSFRSPPPPPPFVSGELRRRIMRRRSGLPFLWRFHAKSPSSSLHDEENGASPNSAPLPAEPPSKPNPKEDAQRRSPDLQTILRRFWKVAAPYWSSDDKIQARMQLGAVFALTLATTGISVGFNFLGRDFYNALANKDQERFTMQLLYYVGGFAGGIPVSTYIAALY